MKLNTFKEILLERLSSFYSLNKALGSKNLELCITLEKESFDELYEDAKEDTKNKGYSIIYIDTDSPVNYKVLTLSLLDTTIRLKSDQ